MIDPGLPREIAARLAAYDDLQRGTESLKVEYAPLRFSHCDEDDVPQNARAVAQGDDFGVYLVAGGEGCLCLTDVPELAAALLLAERSEG